MPRKSAWSNFAIYAEALELAFVGRRSEPKSGFLRQVKELGEIAQMRKAALLAGDVLCAAV